MFFTIFVRVLLSRRLDFQLLNFSKFRDFPQLPIPFFICFKETTKSRSHWNPKFEIFDGFWGSLFCQMLFSKASCSSWHQSVSFRAEFRHLFISVLAPAMANPRPFSSLLNITILELNRLNFRKSAVSCPQHEDFSKIWPSSRFGLAMAGFGREWTGFWLKWKHKLILIIKSLKE